MPEGHHPIQSLFVSCHLLVDGSEAVLIDTGLFGEPWRIRKLVDRLGLIPASLEKARQLDPRGMVPSHYFGRDWARHRRKFDALCQRVAARRRSPRVV